MLSALFRQRENSKSLRGRRVLATLYRLAAEHNDPTYPAEQTMLDAYHGTGTAAALKRLQSRGLVAATRHHPEPTPHWTLTEAGIAEARSDLGGASQ